MVVPTRRWMSRRGPGGVRVQGLSMCHRPGEVGVNCHVEQGFAQLAQDHGAKLGYTQRRRPKRNQRLRARFLKLLACGPGDPLREHGKGPTGLLKLG